VSLPPIALAVLLLDACGWALLVPAAWTSLRVLDSWAPGSAGDAQLALERRTKASSRRGRGAVALFGAASIVLLFGLVVVLPRIVPGAMCAAGVLEVLPRGRVMVGLRIGTAVAAIVWARLDALNRHTPEASLTLGAARALLIVVVVAALASLRTATALLGLELGRTVSCCSALYDTAAGPPGAASAPWLSGPTAALATAVAGLLVAMLGVRVGWRARPRRDEIRSADHPALLLGFGAASLGWMVLGSLALVRWTAPYVFGAMAHHCPWCLFLPSHGGFGWWAWGALAFGGREAAVILTTAAAARSAPMLRPWADRWNARSAASLAVLTLLLLVLVVGPVLRWRWQTGAGLFG
jgi:hypothetical protein